MPVVRDRDGKVIQKSKNLAGIRAYVRKHAANAIDISEIAPLGGGKLCLLFEDGSSYETNFASFTVLKGFVARWRSLYGTPLTVNGDDAGTVDPKNPKLL